MRVGPLISTSWLLQVAVVASGLVTALYAGLMVQADIKTALSFASLTQVGIIVAEIGFGLRYFALVHIIGHGCLRMLQFVRAALGIARLPRRGERLGERAARIAAVWERWIPRKLSMTLYQLALSGYLDAWLTALPCHCCAWSNGLTASNVVGFAGSRAIPQGDPTIEPALVALENRR